MNPNKPMNWAHWGPDPARVTSSHGPGSYQLTARSRGHALSLGKVPAPSHLTTAPVFTHGAPDVRRLAPPVHRLPLQLWFAPPANRLPLTLTVCPTSLAPSWLWHVLPHLNFGGREGNIMFEVITCYDVVLLFSVYLLRYQMWPFWYVGHLRINMLEEIKICVFKLKLILRVLVQFRLDNNF
jgi:hypothetical protein